MLEQLRPALRNTWYKGRLVLLFPWLVVAAIAVGADNGWDNMLTGLVPIGWVDWHRAIIGSVALFVGCFACWAYFRYHEKGYRGQTLLALTVLWTINLSGLAAIISVLGLWLLISAAGGFC